MKNLNMFTNKIKGNALRIMVKVMHSDKKDNLNDNSEFFELTEDEYFFIDSNNLNSVKQKLYGFAVYEDMVITDSNIREDILLSGTGTYVWVRKMLDSIEILQDFNGSYGLFVFEKEDYFAISNSFTYLVEHLKEKETLTLNKDFAYSFFVSGLCSFIYSQTLVNEIEMIPRHFKLLINIKDKSLKYEEIDYGEATISIDSPEGMDVLDTWHDNWVRFIRKLKSDTDYINVDLSGGFDSRIVFALVLSSNIDIDKIRVNSRIGGGGAYDEDYEIASQIAERFGFKLNNNLHQPIKNFSQMGTPINLSFYAKLGFHRQMYFKMDYCSKPAYKLNGSGGEAIRSYWNYSPQKFIEDSLKSANFYSPQLAKPTEYMLNDTFKKIQEKHNVSDADSNQLTSLLYKETRCRNHFGKSNTGNYLTNRIEFHPLLDPMLHRLKLSDDKCGDNNLLMSVIFTRYCPELLDFKFEGNRKIDEETILHAKKINERYPYEKEDLDLISESDDTDIIIPKTLSVSDSNEKIEMDEIKKLLLNVFLSDYFRERFESNFPKEVYSRILTQMNPETLFIPENVYSSIAMVKVIDDINFGQKTYETTFDWINSIPLDRTERIAKDNVLIVHKFKGICKKVLKSFGIR